MLSISMTCSKSELFRWMKAGVSVVFASEAGMGCETACSKRKLSPAHNRESLSVTGREMKWFYTLNNITKTKKLIVIKCPNEVGRASAAVKKMVDGRQTYRRGEIDGHRHYSYLLAN